jgi:hypothetical protein
MAGSMAETGDLALALMAPRQRKAMGRGRLLGGQTLVLVDRRQRTTMARDFLLRTVASGRRAKGFTPDMLGEDLTPGSAVAGTVGAGDPVGGHRCTIRVLLRRENGMVPSTGRCSLPAEKWSRSSSRTEFRLHRETTSRR